MTKLDSLEAVSEFSAFDTPLLAGVNLIEASAGTGKTFSIAMLVLRFVVEQKLSIEQILVVTFTKAATHELKTRIRLRLQDLRNYLLNPSQSESLDSGFTQWADHLPDIKEAIHHVNQALATIDNAAIFTIHGFCQRMLKQYALESGQLFDAELTAGLAPLQLSLAEDYWRQQMYQASPLKASLLGDRFKTPEALATSIKNIHPGMIIVPDKQAVDTLVAKIETTSNALARSIEDFLIQPLAELMVREPASFKDSFIASFEQLKIAISTWRSDRSSGIPIASLQQLSLDRLSKDALDGRKFPKKGLMSGEERKLAFFNAAGITGSKGLEELLKQIEQLSSAFRLDLFEFIQRHLDHKKDALNVLSYDDLIARLAKAIEAPDNLLTASLQRQFSVALIDEFQDTDQQQWDIFSGVYNTENHYLYLIGDPKQAVYKFRGADIYSYLDAKKTADRAYTLERNFRSSATLLESINFLYSKSANPFLIDDIPYHPVKAGKDEDPNWAGGKAQGLVLWCLEDNPNHKSGYWTSGVAREAIRKAVVNEIVSLLEVQQTNSTEPLQPKAIAILVRGNAEAAKYQSALQQAKVPAVINSKNSVFDSKEATYLQQLLSAIERPNDLQRLRQALVLPWFALDGQAFDALCRDDFALQHYVMEFQGFQQRWQELGLIAMMKSLLDHYQMLQVISRDVSAERRITNLHHLLEIIQQVALDERFDIHKTLNWLILAIQGESRDEGTELRLEQDQEAVNIVTIHGAKGLEYPVVFVPELWYEQKVKNEPASSDVVICHKNGKLIADLGSNELLENFQQAQFESQAEDLRLLYVAITRAANRCYLPWATVRGAKKDNHSAFAYLLEPHAGGDWQSKLSNLGNSADGIEYAVIEWDQTPSVLTPPLEANPSLRSKTASRTIKQMWRMSSYSSLAYLSQHEQELPQDKSEEPVEIDDSLPEQALEVLPKGAHTGNVLHDLLENNRFEDLSDLSEMTSGYEDYEAMRTKCCIRYGLSLEPGAEVLLDDLLVSSVKAPLDPDDDDFYLANIPDENCLKEMAFYFSVTELQTTAINQLLASQASYQSLSMRQLSGQLTGFIDLICKYQGRYYVMDYKSNSLPHYDSASLQNAMHQHNYGLQYFIYSLVLHHYLQQRLPDYRYEEHFGGVRYLFLRGMDKTRPMQGVFVDKPSLAIIEGLGSILNGVSSHVK